ncbi:MAG: hypothetical protein M3067_11915 [Chloroflexota bacterium]|nr:hypothetical protein [Chloroflexota bacterium]
MGGLRWAVVLILAIGCATPSPSGPPTAEPARPIRAEAREGDFRLILQSSDDHYAAGAPIDLATELSYIGPQPGLKLAGSGSGLVQVSLLQLDGTLRIEAGSDDSCAAYAIRPAAPLAQRYVKSGGWSGEDPNAAFYKAFFADPVLRLPRGTWRMVADAWFYVDDCGGRAHRLQAALDVRVE